MNIMNSDSVMTGGGHVEMETDEGLYQKNSRAYFGRRGDWYCYQYSALAPLVYTIRILFNLVRLDLIPVGYMLKNISLQS